MYSMYLRVSMYCMHLRVSMCCMYICVSMCLRIHVLRTCAPTGVYVSVCMHVTLDTLCLPRPIPEPLFTLFLPFRSGDLPSEEGGVGDPDTWS